MSITKVFNPRLNQYTYYTEENGQLITLTYEDGLKQGLAVVEQIKQEVKEWYWNPDIQDLAENPFVVDAMTDMFIRMLNKALKEVEQ